MPELLIKILEQFAELDDSDVKSIEQLIASAKRVMPEINDEDTTELVLQMGVAQKLLEPSVLANFKTMRQTPSQVNSLTAKMHSGAGVKDFFTQFKANK